MKYTVGVADMRVSGSPDDLIVTHALGSCLGITVYDPVARVGGMLHVMLPKSSINPEKAERNPFMFVDTGVPRLFLDCYKAGGLKQRLIVNVAGGSALTGTPDEDFFNIGQRNFTMLRKLLWKNGVLLRTYDVGGCESRTMSLRLRDGEVTVRSNGESRALWKRAPQYCAGGGE